LSAGVVGAVNTVFEEVAQVSPSARRVRTADPGAGDCTADAIDRIVVQLPELFGGPAPVADVRLVPDLPIPRFDLAPAVSLEAMIRPSKPQVGPLAVVLRRERPACVDLFISGTGPPVVLIRLRPSREVLGHETDLHVGSYGPRTVRVENAIQDGPVVNGMSLGICAVGAG